MCLECKHDINRSEMQELLQTCNPKWSAESETIIPDVLLYLTPEQTDGFKVKYHEETIFFSRLTIIHQIITQ